MSLIKRFGRAYRTIFMDGFRPDGLFLKVTEIPVRIYRRLMKQYLAHKIPEKVFTRPDIEAWVRTEPESRAYLSMRDWRMPGPVQSDDRCLYYNVDHALQLYPGIAGVALIFFCGIGDYLYMTPALEAFRRRYARLKISAFASSGLDNNNSPFVYHLLKTNPNIDSVHQYNGFPNKHCWKNYDFDDAMKDIPDDFLVIPMTYRVFSDMHRIEEVYNTLCLEPPVAMPRPKLYASGSPAPIVDEAADDIIRKSRSGSGVCFIQFDNRSSAYTYPYSVELAKMLLDRGYVVITSAQQEHPDHANLFQLDFKRFAITDSFDLLRKIRENCGNFKFIGCNSMSWALSGALDVPFLSVQNFREDHNFSLWFPNIKVVTPIRYPRIPAFNQFVDSTAESKEVRSKFCNTMTFFTYSPATMMRYFELL